MKLIEKYTALLPILTKNLIGKDEIIKRGLITLLSGENMILIGPPGTAKSEIARRLTKVIKGGECFEYLLTKFTTPEELFGPVSLNDLKNNVFKRQTDGYMPTAHIAFLDEIFKANSSILNSLLTIINEKVYHNGKVKEKSNILSVIGASNELPIGEAELEALYDRFLLRKVVGYLGDNDIPKLYDIVFKEEVIVPEELKFTVEEILELSIKSKEIKISEDIKTILQDIRKEIKSTFNGEEFISDRKFVKLLGVLRISAYLNERDEVIINDLPIILDCLWNKPENRFKIQDIVNKKIDKKIRR